MMIKILDFLYIFRQFTGKNLPVVGRGQYVFHWTKRFVRCLWAGIILALVMAITPQIAGASKYASVVIDVNTGKVLKAVNADARRYPASLTKIMTLYMVFDALDRKKVTLKTKMRASRRAAGATPSKIGLREGDTITVENAILALVTKSANDVAVVVAEHLGGTEIAFARLMNAKALDIGMKRTTFRNASGLPNRHQMSTARDMAVLGMRIYKDFPHYYSYFARTSFTYGGRTYGNHNKLLKSLPGTDGIKTGYIRDSGFNLVASTVQHGHRLIGVVFGGRTGQSRDDHMKKILGAAFVKVKNGSTGARTPDHKQTLALQNQDKSNKKSASESQKTVQANPSKKTPNSVNMQKDGHVASADLKTAAGTMGVKSLRSPLLANQSDTKGVIRLVPLHQDASVADVQQTEATLNQTDSPIKPDAQSAVQRVTLQSVLQLAPTPQSTGGLELAVADAYVTKDGVADVNYDSRMNKLLPLLDALQNRDKIQQNLLNTNRQTHTDLSMAPSAARLSIQVGAYSSLSKAQKAMEILRTSLGTYAQQLTIFINPVAMGEQKRDIFRLRMGNVPDTMVSEICATVQTQGLGCFKVGSSK